jgi:hypothetical protein
MSTSTKAVLGLVVVGIAAAVVTLIALAPGDGNATETGPATVPAAFESITVERGPDGAWRQVPPGRGRPPTSLIFNVVGISGQSIPLGIDRAQIDK